MRRIMNNTRFVYYTYCCWNTSSGRMRALGDDGENGMEANGISQVGSGIAPQAHCCWLFAVAVIGFGGKWLMVSYVD